MVSYECGKIVFPPSDEELEGVLFFLAGAIKGADRWQDRAIEYLHENLDWANIASPRKSLDRAADYTENDYISQVDWESKHLRRAAENGVIIFWFAREKTHFCDRPYARTTRIEFGEWMTRHELTGAKLAVGFEPGFDGEKYILHRLQAYPEIPVCRTLEETCDAAIHLVLQH